jgi:hypothetical protein
MDAVQAERVLYPDFRRGPCAHVHHPPNNKRSVLSSFRTAIRTGHGLRWSAAQIRPELIARDNRLGIDGVFDQ